MNYVKIYSQLVLKRRQNPINKIKGKYGEVEYHHIIPIKCGGRPTPRKKKYNQFGTNLVGLTPKEHFVAHHLIAKMYEGTEYDQVMWSALNILAHTKKNRIKVSARLFEKLRKNEATLSSKRNTGYKHTEEAKQKMRNRKCTDETRRKLSEAGKGRISPKKGIKTNKPAWNRGLKTGPAWNKNKHLSDETKLKLSKAHKGKRLSDETKKKMSIAHKGRHLSDETKKKMSKAKLGFRKGIKYITNGICLKQINPTDKLPDGFHYGRK